MGKQAGLGDAAHQGGYEEVTDNLELALLQLETVAQVVVRHCVNDILMHLFERTKLTKPATSGEGMAATSGEGMIAWNEDKATKTVQRLN